MTPAIDLQTVLVKPALTVNARCPTAQIGATLGGIFAEVVRWASVHGIPLAGPAIARYARVTPDECEVDAGFVVDRAAPPAAERVHTTELGGCAAAHATHMGSYESLTQTYDAIAQWMESHGYVAAGPMWEEYSSPPGTPPEQTRTDVYWPVRKR